MLNIFSNAESAAGPRAGFALGALLPSSVGTVRPDGTGAIARPRPASTVKASTVKASTVKASTVTAGPAAAGTATASTVSLAQPFGLQSPCEKYAHMTHFVTGGGDALGPHSARDPV
jgi:hypothetical protein